MVETPEAASLAPMPCVDPRSPLQRQARARSGDKRAAAGFSRPDPSFLTGARSGAVKPFLSSSRRATDTPQTGANVETRRVSSDSSSSPYSSAMEMRTESSESTELLLAHKDSEMAEDILPKVSKLKADSSSRSPPLLRPGRASLPRSYSVSSGLAAASGAPMKKFDGLSSGARFYNNVVQQMYRGDQRKRNAKTSESDPATAGAPSPRATECAPVSPVSTRESKTSHSKPATAEAAPASSVTSSTEVGPSSPRKPGSSAGPSREQRRNSVRPFQPSRFQASSLFSAITQDLMSTIDTKGLTDRPEMEEGATEISAPMSVQPLAAHSAEENGGGTLPPGSAWENGELVHGTFSVYRARHVVETI